MKYLFIDESIDSKYYVVGGVLVNKENDLLFVYNQIKRQILNMSLTDKQKKMITTEFKSTLLDRTFPLIKRKFLYKLNAIDCNVIYSYKEIKQTFNKEYNESTYIDLLTNIVNYINDDVLIVSFDNFSNTKFEDKIIKTIGSIPKVKSIKTDYSYNNKGLQFADNVVGVIRRKLNNNDPNEFYDIISNKVIQL